MTSPPADRPCPTCGTPLAAGALFCTTCGASTPTELALSAAPPAEDAAYAARLQGALGPGYLLGARIGQGGFGAVYRATDRQLKRDVAVKVTRSDLAIPEAMQARFLREAEAVAKLSHPHIIPIYLIGQGEGLSYFIMPLVQGESLLARLQREGTLSAEETRRILIDVAGALGAAHRVGIVHRDLKPENIMLEGEDHRVLLMDFGIAKSLGPEAHALTSQGMVVGTPYYMSPEQAMGSPTIDGRSDLYSLGVLGYQMLTGRVPFDSDSAQGVLMMHITAPPPDLPALKPDAPRALTRAIMRCLAKKPGERWSTSEELIAALEVQAMPGAAPAGRRWGKWAAVAGTLLIAIGGVNLARRRPPPAVPSASGVWRTRWEDLEVSTFWDTVDYVEPRIPWIAVLHDSLLISADPDSGRIWVLRQDTLTVLPGVPTRLAPLVGHDTLWSVGPYDLHAIGTASPVAYPTPGLSPPSAGWSDGEDIYLGYADGGIVRQAAGGWRKEASGTRARIRSLFGRDSLLRFALVDRDPRTGSDSLLVFNGVAWSARDIRVDRNTDAHYAAGWTFQDGVTAVVGSACDRDAKCHPVLLREEGPGAPWQEIPLRLPAQITLTGVWGSRSSEYYVWGTDTTAPSYVGCDLGGPCLFRVRGAVVEPVGALAGIRVTGMVSRGGRVYALLEDGTVRTPSDSGWAVFAELPRQHLVALAATPSLGPVGIRDDGTAVIGTAHFEAPARQHFAAVAARDSLTWLLTDGGKLEQYTCRRAPDSPLDCQRRDLTVPNGSPILTFAILPGGDVLAVAKGRWVMRWDGTVWHAETVPFAPGDTTAFRLASNRWGTGLQGRYLYTRDSSGTWSYYSQGGDVERRFSPIADGTIASVSQWESMDDVPSWQIDRLHRLSTLTDSTQLELSEETYWESSFPLVLLSLADGRLVIGTADHGDPSVSGWLQVWSPPFRRSAFVRVELPRSSDITSLAEDGTYLYVAGSGDFLMRVRLDSLPGRP